MIASGVASGLARRRQNPAIALNDTIRVARTAVKTATERLKKARGSK